MFTLAVTDTDTETKTDKMAICFGLGVGQCEVTIKQTQRRTTCSHIFGKYYDGKIEDKQNRATWSHSSGEKAVILTYIAN